MKSIMSSACRFSAFVSCATRAGVLRSANCASKDLDHDGDADMNDFGIFQRCYSGQKIPGAANCAS
jgi:hypothetical protein